MGFLDFIKGGGDGIISSVIGGGMGLMSNRRQLKAQKEMQEASFEYGREMAETQRRDELERMGVQFDYNKRTAQYNQDLARDMYKYTFDMQNRYNNPEAELKRYKDAGLNTALLYGGGGAGGQSTSASSAGGAAPAVTSLQPMGIQVGLQAKQQAADIELTMAQANKLKAETLKESTIDMAQGVMNLINSVNNNEKVKADKQKVTKEIEVLGENIEKVKADAEQVRQNTELIKFQNKINELKQNATITKYVGTDGEMKESGKITFEEMIIGSFTKEWLIRQKILNRDEVQAEMDKDIAYRLYSDLEMIVQGKLNEISISGKTLEKLQAEIDRSKWELKNDKALGDVIEEIGGDSKYSKLLMMVIQRLLNK